MSGKVNRKEYSILWKDTEKAEVSILIMKGLLEQTKFFILC